jgi:hypothetical protein
MELVTETIYEENFSEGTGLFGPRGDTQISVDESGLLVQNPDYWKDGAYGYSRFRDTETVDNTLTLLYEGRYEPSYRDYVPGFDWGPTWDWGSMLGAETVIEKIEMAKPVVDAAIEEANK